MLRLLLASLLLLLQPSSAVVRSRRGVVKAVRKLRGASIERPFLPHVRTSGVKIGGGLRDLASRQPWAQSAALPGSVGQVIVDQAMPRGPHSLFSQPLIRMKKSGSPKNDALQKDVESALRGLSDERRSRFIHQWQVLGSEKERFIKGFSDCRVGRRDRLQASRRLAEIALLRRKMVRSLRGADELASPSPPSSRPSPLKALGVGAGLSLVAGSVAVVPLAIADWWRRAEEEVEVEDSIDLILETGREIERKVDRVLESFNAS